jgi:hypothetical protein
MSNNYGRWHCDVGRSARPDASTVAAPVVIDVTPTIVR